MKRTLPRFGGRPLPGALFPDHMQIALVLPPYGGGGGGGGDFGLQPKGLERLALTIIERPLNGQLTTGRSTSEWKIVDKGNFCQIMSYA